MLHSWWVLYSLLFSILFLATGFLRLNLKNNVLIYLLNLLWALACVLFAYMMPYREVFQDFTLVEFRDNVLIPFITKENIKLNLLCIITVIGILFSVTARFHFSVMIGSFSLIILAIVNGFIYLYRGNELIFADLMSWNTALNVAGQYDLRLHYRTAILLGIWAVLVLSGWILPPLPKRNPILRRLTALGSTLILAACLSFGAENIAITMWRRDGTLFNGYYLNFYLSILGRLDTQTDAPLFLFGITMQNHGGYAYSDSNVINTIVLDEYPKDYPQAQKYLSLIQISDQALEGFIGALENYPENVLVLFFGDHLPKIETEFYEELHGGPYETLTEQTLQYTVPFVIWANYDIPEQTVEKTSLNYLGRYLLEAAGIDLPIISS